MTVADATLAYQEHGAGDPLLLIHGFSTTGEAWDHLLPSFVDRYREIVPDLRGHVVGHSGGGASLYVAIRQQQAPRLRTLTLIGGGYGPTTTSTARSGSR